MGPFTAGKIVLVRFPFSDLSRFKLRPALILADADRGDWLLCQITSNPYGDPRRISLVDGDFRAGSLRPTSYARPARLFTAHQTLITGEAGILKDEKFEQIVDAIITVLRPPS